MILKSQSYSSNLEEYIRSNSLELALGLVVLVILTVSKKKTVLFDKFFTFKKNLNF